MPVRESCEESTSGIWDQFLAVTHVAGEHGLPGLPASSAAWARVPVHAVRFDGRMKTTKSVKIRKKKPRMVKSMRL